LQKEKLQKIKTWEPGQNLL